MPHVDRLSALIQRFEMRVSVAAAGTGNLVIFGDRLLGLPSAIELRPLGRVPVMAEGDDRLVEAEASWGGDANPLMRALPEQLRLDCRQDEETSMLARMLLSEALSGRCGAGSAMSRLGEVMLIRLLRAEIARGTTRPGLLAGLADPRLSRAIVAIHEAPGSSWRNAELADLAGMSLSRFCETFTRLLGEAPQAYLRRWRMTVARQDLVRGDRVQAVARRLGYGSSEALTRAFRREQGRSPSEARRAATSH